MDNFGVLKIAYKNRSYRATSHPKVPDLLSATYEIPSEALILVKFWRKKQQGLTYKPLVQTYIRPVYSLLWACGCFGVKCENVISVFTTIIFQKKRTEQHFLVSGVMKLD